MNEAIVLPRRCTRCGCVFVIGMSEMMNHGSSCPCCDDGAPGLVYQIGAECTKRRTPGEKLLDMIARQYGDAIVEKLDREMRA